MNKYVFRRYAPELGKLFAVEKKGLLKNLGKNAHVEHIGSTAVAGLGGKNILDIMVGIDGMDLGRYKQRLALSGFGFVKKASHPYRLFFFKDRVYLGKPRSVHAHLVRYNGREWREKIAFRDFLRSNKEKVLEYARIKKRAARMAKGKKEIYLKEKEDFIKKATIQALKEK